MRATGVVMQRFNLASDRAFEVLTRVSRIEDLTLDALASQILEEITEAAGQSVDERPVDGAPS